MDTGRFIKVPTVNAGDCKRCGEPGAKRVKGLDPLIRPGDYEGDAQFQICRVCDCIGPPPPKKVVRAGG